MASTTHRKAYLAHVARIPYDNLSIMLGRPDPVDLLLSVGDVTEDEWRWLWDRTTASHRAWDEAGRP